MHRSNRISIGSLLWPIILGVGLTLVLLFTLAPDTPAEAQPADQDSLFLSRPLVARSMLPAKPSTDGSWLHPEGGPSGARDLAGSAGIQMVSPGVTVDLFQHSVWGKVGPGQIVTITGTGDVYGAAQADATGFFWTPLWDGAAGARTEIAVGDPLSVYVDGAPRATITPPAISGAVDPLLDQVYGKVIGDGGGTVVTATVKGHQATDATDSSGEFSIDFIGILDLDAEDWADVDVADGGRVRARLFPVDHLVVNSYDSLEGYVQPGQIVTATVYTGTTSVKIELSTFASADDGWYAMQPGVPIDPGDLVEVDLGAGNVISTIVAGLSLEVEPGIGEVSGNAPTGEQVTVAFWRWVDNENRYFAYSTTASGDAYSVQSDALVDWPEPWVHVTVSDENGNETWLFGGAPFLNVNADWDDAWARVDAGGVPVTATLHTGSETYTWNGGSHPIYRAAWGIWFDGGMGNPVDIEAGHVITVETSTWTGSMTVADVALGFDVVADEVRGEAPAGHGTLVAYQRQSSRYPINGSAGQTVTIASPFAVALADFDLRFGGSFDFWHYNADGNSTHLYRDLPAVQIELPNGAGGYAWVPDEAVTATLYLSDGVSVKYSTSDDHDGDPRGFWFGDWAGNTFAPSDWLTVTGASGWAAGAQIVELTVNVDPIGDRMYGHAPVGLLDSHWDDHPGDQNSDESTPTDASGGYLIDWSAYNVDVQRGHNLRPYYASPSGVQIARNFRWPEARVNYGHDWVEGNYEPGHTLWITVTESDSATVKATAQLETQIIPWWGGETGFSTNLDDPWAPAQPDLIAGDWVFARVDDGYAFSMHLGLISGTLDIVADTVSGAITAPWYTETLNANCGIWQEGGPGTDFQVDPNGGAYECDFGAMGWDLQPGHDVGVEYQQPDGNWVGNVFREPAPDIRAEKWVEGGGEVPPDGSVVFTLRYSNEGDVTADTVWITDTLPGDTSYVSDSSGATPSIDGQQLTWTLGPLGPHQAGQFQVLLENTATASQTLTNDVEVGAPFDSNLDNNFAEADVHVADGQPDLYVHKDANPGHPAAGQTFLWRIEYGNQGPVASGPVTLTDTLPLSTSIESWSSTGGYGFWTDASTDSEFVLTAPTLPGYWNDTVLLRLRVEADVSVGTQLTNTVYITTGGDTDPENNFDLRDNVYVSDPDRNVTVDKNWGWGELVPGRSAGYGVYYGNSGNMPAQTWITDVLPSGTSFVTSTQPTGVSDQPLPPLYVGEGIVVWDMGVLEPGADGNLNIELAISPSMVPDTVITNCVTIAITETDNWPYDNYDCVAETVRAAGPNLRVRKESRWLSEDQVEYTVNVENIGTTVLTDVAITDTLPVSTSFSGDWWHSFWDEIQFADHGGQLVWMLARFEPGWSTGLGFNVNLDSGIIGTQGLVFSNTVEAPVIGDVYPADNISVDVTSSGPDVYVRKTLTGGEPRPGDTVTYTIEFGNHNRWWGTDDQYGSRITDTLPAEMSFVSASAPWNPDWVPDEQIGNTLVWNWGTLCPGCTWYFDVAAQIADTAVAGDVLTNTVEVYGDSPSDVEADLGNNLDAVPVTILAPGFQVNKVYESSRVVGSNVVYTLTVLNLGNAPGTNVVLSDTVPAGLSNIDTDGTYDGQYITWLFPNIDANGGTATGWFTAQLPGTVQQSIVNDRYRVVSSDQGVTSAPGPAVSFVTQYLRIYLPLMTRNY